MSGRRATFTMHTLAMCFIALCAFRLLVPWGSSSSSSSSSRSTAVTKNTDLRPYTLAHKRSASPDSQLLTFALPAGTTLERPASSAVTVQFGGGGGTDTDHPYEKSYSVVSHPARTGSFDLLVRSYPPAPGGGVGHYLCNLPVGGRALMRIKPPRQFGGKAGVLGRWRQLGLVAGGTGVAPFVQIIRTLLADPADATRIALLSVNRHGPQADALLREELDALAALHPARLRTTWHFTAPPAGRGDLAALGRRALPPTTGGDGGTMVMVCGRDGFVGAWAGVKVKKQQGAVRGALKELGYTDSEVYRY